MAAPSATVSTAEGATTPVSLDWPWPHAQEERDIAEPSAALTTTPRPHRFTNRRPLRNESDIIGSLSVGAAPLLFPAAQPFFITAKWRRRFTSVRFYSNSVTKSFTAHSCNARVAVSHELANCKSRLGIDGAE